MTDTQEMPVYPHPLIRDIRECDRPIPYDGDISNLNSRKNYKLLNIWGAWSDIRKNERFLKLLEKKEDESNDIKELKYVFVLLMDRIARILYATNLLDELNE